MKVSPSILAMDFSKKEEEILKIDQTDCEYIHLDVMDGIFVPNVTFDYNLIKDLNSKKIYDTHLMIEKPLSVIDKYLEVSEYVTFHLEAEAKENILSFLKNKGNKKIGLSIKPNTKVEDLNDFLEYLDLVLVMSVEPGFGGQKFMDIALDKIKYLKEQKTKKGYHYLIEVDGGINHETSKLCKEVGCEIVVAGTYIFKHQNYQEQINNLR